MIKISVKDNSPELMQKVESAISRFVRKGALYIEGQIESSIAEPKSGKEYPRGESNHIASAPGESPASDSSNLLTSVEPDIQTLEAKIGTPVEYSEYLEDGTQNMEERPLWDQTRKESLPTLEILLANEIRSIR